ncbi:MAG: VWA domain-containing protein [Planctomycetes bacterium]|nr:VWA domain-containing protein [Planctomycetota bacterium]
MTLSREEHPDLPSAVQWRGALRSSVSGLVSIVVHMAIILTLGLVTCNSRGEGEGAGEEVLLGELPEVILTASSDEQLDATPIASQPQAEEEFQAPLDIAPQIDNSAAAFQIDVVSLAPSGASSGSAEFGAVGGGGGAAGGGASFMGVYAHGNRFCIIADCSGSMRGPKLEHVKTEILETISGMGRQARFQLVFFHSRENPFPRPGWRNPRRDHAEVQSWLNSVEAGGGTHPTPAFRIGLSLSPRPDAIFFMTDGQFDPAVVEDVAALNHEGQRRVKINTISFIDRSAEHQMRRIAEDSGGVYRHVAGF